MILFSFIAPQILKPSSPISEEDARTALLALLRFQYIVLHHSMLMTSGSQTSL